MVTYVGETLAAVEAKGLETSVTQHLDDLGIFLAVLLEGQLSALVIVLLGTSSAVLASLLLQPGQYRMLHISSHVGALLVEGCAPTCLQWRGRGNTRVGTGSVFLRRLTFPLFLGMLTCGSGGARYVKRLL